MGPQDKARRSVLLQLPVALCKMRWENPTTTSQTGTSPPVVQLGGLKSGGTPSPPGVRCAPADLQEYRDGTL